MVAKRWTIASVDNKIVTELQQALKIHPVLCRLLAERGITDFDNAKNFFRPGLEALHDPWLMKDMEKAVRRIETAIQKGEKILVFGDYDVDGTTSVATMVMFLQKLTTAIDFYIPHRYREGYGVSKAGIDFAKANGFSLIISLDCGIKSNDLIAYAVTLDIDFIVCDHHLPDKLLPPAVAILNPKQNDCPYPYKDLCGCGVGFKLISALAERMKIPTAETYEYLDLLATAIAADIVPMTGENRILAFHGLIKANTNPNHGIKALMTLSGLVPDKKIQIANLVFLIAPRVNAAGRMDDARKAVEMFVATDEQTAFKFAQTLHSDNSDRKEADKAITDEALMMISQTENWNSRKSTVVFQPHWHKGVVGIVASRIIEHYFKPTIVLTQSGEFAAGSARSVPGFNLYEAIHACKEYLIGYGGHFAAAGMTLEVASVDAFREKFEEVVASRITDEQRIPEIVIDSEIKLSDIRKPLFDIISQMEPFGPGNIRPVFLARNVRDTGRSKVLKDKHIRFSLKQDDTVVQGIGFGLADKFALLQTSMPVDIVFSIAMNDWNDQKSLQLTIIDLALSPA